jgi:hypothetical protein
MEGKQMKKKQAISQGMDKNWKELKNEWEFHIWKLKHLRNVQKDGSFLCSKFCQNKIHCACDNKDNCEPINLIEVFNHK